MPILLLTWVSLVIIILQRLQSTAKMALVSAADQEHVNPSPHMASFDNQSTLVYFQGMQMVDAMVRSKNRMKYPRFNLGSSEL